MNTDKTEAFTFYSTTVLLLGGLALMFVGFALEVSGFPTLTDSIQEILDVITTALLVLVLIGWYVVARYLLAAPPEKPERKNYILLICTVLVPPSGIYVLRYIRSKHRPANPR